MRAKPVCSVFKLHWLRWAVCLLLGASPSLFAQTAPNQAIEQRIRQSSQALSTLEKSIATESGQYHQALSEKEQALAELRKEAALVQRMADEQLLGIEELAARVEQWSAQSKYQRHLLHSYVGAAAMTIPTSGADDLMAMDVLSLAHTAALSALAPAWKDAELITAQGAIKTLPLLALGPVSVALDPVSGQGGLIDQLATGELRLLEVLDSKALAELKSLRESGQGHLTFDATLGSALKIRESSASAWQYLQAGGMWAVPIVFFGILALIIALLKAWQLMRLPKVRAEITLHDPPASPELGAAQNKMIRIAREVPVSPQRDDLLVACLMETKHLLDRNMGVIATTAAVAPLLGLLGTVSGMISTFKMMTIFGSGDASVVSGGISEALITTELGLIVAIPALVTSALLARKIRSYSHELETFAVKLSKTAMSG